MAELENSIESNVKLLASGEPIAAGVGNSAVFKPPEVRTLIETCSAVIVPGTGLGGAIGRMLAEFGKLGLNAGTDFADGTFPQVPPRGFACAEAFRENFGLLTAKHVKFAKLDARHIAELALRGMPSTDAMLVLSKPVQEEIARCANQALLAMSRVLADTCFLLHDLQVHPHFQVTACRIAGGIAQGETRAFLVKEMHERGGRLGLLMNGDGSGALQLKPNHPLAPFIQELQAIPPTTPQEFLIRAIERAIEHFAVCADGYYQALRRYVPYFALDAIVREFQVRKGECAGVPIKAGEVHLFDALIPTGSDLNLRDPQTHECLRMIVCSIFCKLLSNAMLQSYGEPSNLEGVAAIHHTLAIARPAIQASVRKEFADVYVSHGFFTLIEKYRGLVWARQQHSHPLAAEDLHDAADLVRECEEKCLLGLDTGKGDIKALLGEVREGRLIPLAMFSFPTPAGDRDASPQVNVRHFFGQVVTLLLSKLQSLGLDVNRVCAIGVSWPGPVTSTAPAEYSSLLAQIGLHADSVLATTAGDLDYLDIPAQLGEAWCDGETRDNVPIALVNDGTAFAAYYEHEELFHSDGPLEWRYHGAAGAALMGLAADAPSVRHAGRIK